MMSLRMMTLSLCLALAACASSAPVVVGAKRPPITPAQVKIYMSPPPQFEEIATLNASTSTVFMPGGPEQQSKVIEKLKEQAAALGANGVILEGMSDAQTGSLGTGVGSQSYSGNSAVGLGVGGTFGIYKKIGKGRAIYVPE